MRANAAQLSEIVLEAYQRGDTAMGLAHMERALQLDGSNANLWALLSEMYVEQEQFAAAIDGFQRAISLKPELASAHSGLGRALYEIESWADAEAALARSIELKPSAARMVLLADTQAAQGQRDKAEATLRNALDRYPESEEISFNLGSLLSWKHPDEAASLFRRAIEVNREFAPPYRELGLLAARDGRTAEAEDLLKSSLRLDPDEPWTHLYLGTLLSQLGRFAEAEGAYKAAGAVAPDWAEPYRLLGEMHLDRENLADAVEAFQQATATDPTDADAAYGLGRALLRIGNYSEGRQWLDAALRLGLSAEKTQDARRLLAWE